MKRITVQKSFEKNFSFFTNFSLKIPGYPHLNLPPKAIINLPKSCRKSPERSAQLCKKMPLLWPVLTCGVQ